MDYQTGHVMTLANSIIGVSVLAMPYCFKQCGIVLSILMLLISSIISRLACHFLLKSAIIARRKTFEFLAFYIFGAMGKFAIEIGIIGFLLGTCIAFFVVMGDLGPEIISEISGSYTTNTMRTSILMALALFCVLPLGLLRNVDSLNGVSKATIGFYCCLVLKIVFEGIPHIFTGDWYHSVNFWRPAGILQCLPIFTMALFCQTQLFEIYQALQNATLEEMNNLVRVAVNICTWVYIFVGAFGYIAFFQKPFTGNILLSFPPSLMTDVIKIGFILSVAFSFPLIIFPCRASLYSLLYREGYPLHESVSSYIPEGRFKGLTLFIVFISLIIGIMIPNIELVLGLVGSTIGVMICVLFPVTCFICISQKNTNERILAQLMLMIGIFVMVLGTYKNLYSLDNLEPNTVTISSLKNLDQVDLNLAKVPAKIDVNVEKILTTPKIFAVDSKINVVEKATTIKIVRDEELKEIRHEPPQPIEPVEEAEAKKDEAPPQTELPLKKDVKEPKLSEAVEKLKNDSRNDEVDIEAIRKEDKEVELQEKESLKAGDASQALIEKIQKQNEVQMEMAEQQKKINEEKVKAMKEIESIARQAIEKISGGKTDEKIVADTEKRINENVKANIEEKLEANVKEDGEVKKIVEKTDVEVGKDNFIAKNSKEVKIEKKDTFEIETNSLTGNVPKKETVEKNHEFPPNAVRKKDILTEKKTVTPTEKIPDQNSNKIKKQKDPSAEFIKNSNVSQQSNASNVVNNTAPLFLKLGKSNVGTEESKVKKMMPLPLIMSANLLNNLSKSESLSTVPKEPGGLKNGQIDSKEELKVMRRDILSLKSER